MFHADFGYNILKNLRKAIFQYKQGFHLKLMGIQSCGPIQVFNLALAKGLYKVKMKLSPNKG